MALIVYRQPKHELLMSEAHYIIDILFLLSAPVVTVPMFQRLGLCSVLQQFLH
jgi:hypothetical protein